MKAKAAKEKNKTEQNKQEFDRKSQQVGYNSEQE